jgi:flagellin
MANVVLTNIASLNAQRNLSRSGATLNTSLQRLSSGLRINSAKDDAAGLAISERFTTQIRGLNQAARNANDGISLAQTAEGDLAAVSNNLQRIRELAVQSANATNSTSDRAALQLEVAELISEIDRVGRNSSFNGVKLLDGSFSSQVFQIGANAGETVTITSIASARTTNLGAALSASVTGGTITAATSSGDVTINGTNIGAASDDARSVTAAVNSTVSGVTATAQATSAAGTTTGTTAQTGTITINGSSTASIVLGTDASSNRVLVTDAINLLSAATGVIATNNGSGVDLVAADGRNINLSAATITLANAGLNAAATTRSSVDLSSTDTIVIAGAAPANAGLTAATTNAALSGTAVSLLDISSFNGANTALNSVDAALTAVNSSRALLGAVQNRFDSVISSIQTTSENLSAARSRIRDADFAAETAELAKSQVLQQAGISILSQANATSQGLLQLLQ